jgi:hypothetical protein
MACLPCGAKVDVEFAVLILGVEPSVLVGGPLLWTGLLWRDGLLLGTWLLWRGV